MILKCDNEKVKKLLRYVETLSFDDKIRLSINLFQSDYIDIKNDKMLEVLKNLLSVVDENYNKTKFLNLLNYKHLLLVSAQAMELTNKELQLFAFGILCKIYKMLNASSS